MQISSRFTVGIHTLLCIAYFQDEKAAGLVKVEAGVGGASLAKDPSEITLLDVFDAVSAVDDVLFAFHDAPNPACPVGKNIHAVLDEKLESANQALRDDLAKTTLKDLLDAIL